MGDRRKRIADAIATGGLSLLWPDRRPAPTWPEPTRFDPDDQATWPADETRVLLLDSGRFELAEFNRGVDSLADPNVPNWWLERSYDWAACQAGDLWLPLPPTPKEGS